MATGKLPSGQLSSCDETPAGQTVDLNVLIVDSADCHQRADERFGRFKAKRLEHPQIGADSGNHRTQPSGVPSYQ